MNVEDVLAIQQMIALYSYTFDSRDAAGWADLFTEDAVWESVRSGAATPSTRLEGRAELIQFAEQRYRDTEGVRFYHHQSGVVFDSMTADTAQTRAMLIITAQKGSEPLRVTLTGVYHDRWLKTPQGWRFAHRVLRT